MILPVIKQKLFLAVLVPAVMLLLSVNFLFWGKFLELYENIQSYNKSAVLINRSSRMEVRFKDKQSAAKVKEAVYEMSDEELKQAVTENKAVIVWMTGERESNIIQKDGYNLVEGEHVYVVIGVTKDGRFLVHDPWGARADSGRTGTFIVLQIYQWDLFGRMVVTVPFS